VSLALLLDELAERRVELQAEDGKLRYEGPEARRRRAPAKGQRLQASARLKRLTGHELSLGRFIDSATIPNLALDLPAPPEAAPESVAPGHWEEGEL
jgi:hypothetical protein